MTDEPVTDQQSATVLQIITPNTTPEEIAILTAVFAAVGGEAAPTPSRRTPEWSAHHRKTRVNFLSGRGGWRSSAQPR